MMRLERLFDMRPWRLNYLTNDHYSAIRFPTRPQMQEDFYLGITGRINIPFQPNLDEKPKYDPARKLFKPTFSPQDES